MLIALGASIPLLFVVSETISVGWHDAYALIVRPRVSELLSNTIRLILGTVTASCLLGVACAWLIERTSLPGKGMWRAALVAPLAVPAFVNSYSWVSLTPRVEGVGGAVLVTTLSYYPLVLLPVGAALRGIDPALEDAARALGNGPARSFCRVVAPQLRPSLGGGALLVALHLLAEFGALRLLRFPTFTTAIYDQYKSTFNGAAATMLASVLVTLCCVALLLEHLSRGSGRYARVGAGAARTAPQARLGSMTPVVILGLLGVIGLALGVPIASLVYWMAKGASTAFPVATLVSTSLSSIGLAGLGAVVAVAVALPGAWLVERRPGWLSTLTERATYIGHSLPGIVVALSLVTISIRHAHWIYQSLWLLLAAYTILFFPLAMVAIRTSLAQTQTVLADSARSLGVGPIATFRRVTLPLAAPGIGAGAALVFLAIMTELTATLLLAPIGTRTLATRFWSNAASVDYGAAAPYAALMVLISLPATIVLTRRTSR